jgi:hypothetical protein
MLPMDTPQRVYLRPREAATHLNLSPRTLENMRHRGDGPPFLKAGRRIVLYELSELEAWLRGRSDAGVSA